MEQIPAGRRIGTDVVSRFVDVAAEALSRAREEIDALNVYPVPDGDTGTNMFLTMSAAREGLREALAADPDDLGAAMAALSRGALLGARGNSGVILSQLLGAVVGRIARARPIERNAKVTAAALVEATEAAYAAVGTPVEGTILTVARAASDAASASALNPRSRARDVFAAAAAAAREALERTPEQLPVLRAAGVVDAGGRGLCVILDAAETVLTGRRPVSLPASRRARPIPTPVLPTGTEGDLQEDGPAYEVMYLLDAPDEAIAPLRSALAPLGDSLVVVGGDGLWNVHVHVNDVGAAVEAGIAAGRPHRIQVTHFAEQMAAARARITLHGRSIVAVAAGDGLAGLFAEAGATIVPGAPGRRPSTGAILEAIVGTGAAEVVVLPNDADSVKAAEFAARTAEQEHPVRVAVIPTHAQVQGLAALAVHEPGRGFDADVLEMTATARHARHGAVTVAAKKAITMAGPCEIGDILGVVSGDFAVVGDDERQVAREVVTRLLGAGGELVTLVAGGAEGSEALAADCATWLGEEYPSVDVVVYAGGQERYPLLVGVE